MRVINRFLIVLAMTACSVQATAQARTIFAGVPVIKITEGGTDRTPQELPRSEGVKWECVVSEIGGKFYWATRENKQLSRHTSGSFTTYVAIDGSGYIRVIEPSEKQSASVMSPTEAEFDYVEHLLIGLRSVTYYGHTR